MGSFMKQLKQWTNIRQSGHIHAGCGPRYGQYYPNSMYGGEAYQQYPHVAFMFPHAPTWTPCLLLVPVGMSIPPFVVHPPVAAPVDYGDDADRDYCAEGGGDSAATLPVPLPFPGTSTDAVGSSIVPTVVSDVLYLEQVRVQKQFENDSKVVFTVFADDSKAAVDVHWYEKTKENVSPRIMKYLALKHVVSSNITQQTLHLPLNEEDLLIAFGSN